MKNMLLKIFANFTGKQENTCVIVYFLVKRQAHRIEKSSWGVTKFEILSATIVGRGREFLISNCLKGLEKFNFCRKWVM